MESEKKEEKLAPEKNAKFGRMSLSGAIILIVVTSIMAIAATSDVLERKHSDTSDVLERKHSEHLAKLSIEYDREAKEKDKKFVEGTERFVIEYKADKKEVFGLLLLKAIRELQPKLDVTTAGKIIEHLLEESTKRNIDPILMAGLMYEESRFNPMAHSSKGAVGLMQVRYSTWKKQPVLLDNGVSAKNKLYWIDLNIKCGVEIFASYYKKSKYNAVKALHQYNSGSPSLPGKKREHEISYANKVLITAYKIRTMIENRMEPKPSEHSGP